MRPTTPRRVRDRLSGLGATLLIAAFAIGMPPLLFAIGATPWRESNLGTILTSPDDGTLLLLVFAVLAWLVWVLLAALCALEVVAVIRGVPAPRLPGLGPLQDQIGHLVAVAALLFVAAPAVAPAFTPQPAHAAPEAPRQVVLPTVAPLAETSAPAAPVVSADTDATTATVDYTVRRGDSLWKIAEEQLGDPMRFREIVSLNPDALQGRADFINPGMELRLPTDAGTASGGTDETPRAEETYVVEAGDTMWEIADEKLGAGERYPEIFEASRDTVQADGQRLTDPALIRPGWELTVPGTSTAVPPVVDPPVDLEPTEPEPEPDPIEPNGPEVTNSGSPDAIGQGSAADVQAGDSDPGEVAGTPGWLVPGLTGGGAVLAAGLLTALRRRQRTQLRYRRPGHIIVPPPAPLNGVEKTLHVEGSSMAMQIEALDHLLRHISDSPHGLPEVIAVALSATEATLHLAESSADATLPKPWTGAGRTRLAPLQSGTAETNQQSTPPYPLLVAVGQDDGGTVWFLNLGHAPHVAVTGEVTGGEDFLRHLAAELALNPWSAEVDIDTFGFSPSLVGIDPHRLHHHADTRLLDKLTADLAQPGIPGLAPERRRALLLERTYADTDAAHAITSANTTHAARGITVVTVGDHRTDESLALDIDESSRLTLPILGITIAAAGLSDAEASACAAILDATRDATLAPVPVDETATGRDKLVDKAGALRDELVESRPVGPAGGTALLPRPTSEYAEVAATTSEDVETLAPVVPETTRAAVEDADPTLDQEVAWWFDPTCRLPRISVLGPVHGRAYGDATDIAGRKPFYTEMLAFLALHPDGVTSGQVADAFAITTKRARVDMNALRSWLGTNPHTSGPHLPKADESRAARQRGGHFYQVDDVLLDADLFRRLRARGQARGAAGINDLATALRLVTGQPFGQLRNNGWSWVLEGDRLDHILTCAIVDVAHIVTTHALAEGDLAMAHEAAEVAHHAAPYDEITNLDLVAVASAEGHEELAEQLLNDRIYNRSDDDLGPVELPPRTQDMASKRPQNGSQPSGNRPVPAPRKG
jgi:LysM repeat protein